MDPWAFVVFQFTNPNKSHVDKIGRKLSCNFRIILPIIWHLKVQYLFTKHKQAMEYSCWSKSWPYKYQYVILRWEKSHLTINWFSCMKYIKLNNSSVFNCQFYFRCGEFILIEMIQGAGLVPSEKLQSNDNDTIEVVRWTWINPRQSRHRR